MENLKMKKIRGLWLQVSLVAVLGYASQGNILADRANASANLVFSNMPRVGEVFTVTYTITPHVDSSRNYMYPYVVLFVINTSQEKNAYRIVEGSLEQKWPIELTKNVPVIFSISLLVTKMVPIVEINANIRGRGGWLRSLRFYLIDSITGQYGTKEEYEKGLPVEYRYDFIDGSFINSYDQSRVSLEENRRIVKMIKELEPALADSLALLLHSEQYRVGVPKGVPQWDSLNQRWIDKGVFEYYLKDGWLKALQEGKIEQWREQEKKKIESRWKE